MPKTIAVMSMCFKMRLFYLNFYLGRKIAALLLGCGILFCSSINSTSGRLTCNRSSILIVENCLFYHFSVRTYFVESTYFFLYIYLVELDEMQGAKNFNQIYQHIRDQEVNRDWPKTPKTSAS